MTEQQFTNEILAWAKRFKWRAFHVRNSGAGGNTLVQGDKGFPDLVLVRPPRLVFAELKVGKAGTLKGDPTPEQVEWLKALGECEVEPYGMPGPSCETYVWRPESWDEIVKVLSGR
jgi:hypothetical protein